MAQEEIIQSENPVAEVAENTTGEVTNEGTSEAVTTSNEEKVNFEKPVTSSIEAHKVLKAQKELQVKGKIEKTNTDKSKEEFVSRKQYVEIQKLANKHDRELNELRKYHQETQQMRNEWQQAKEAQKQAEIQQMFQQNPQQAYSEIARREADARMAPMQDAIYQVQSQSINNQLQKSLGDKYEEYSPVMLEVIEEFEKIDAYNANNPDPRQRTNYAQEVSANPATLIQLANKKFESINKTKAVDISNQRKNDNLKIASGIAKKSNVKSEATDNFSNLSLQEMTQQMKQLGIIKK